MAIELPVHPSLTHPHTGDPLRALGILPSGRLVWPCFGASPDDDGQGGGQQQNDNQGGQQSGGGQNSGGQGTQGGGQQSGGGQSGDLGFPTGTPVAEMTHEQQAAYHRHQSRGWQGRAEQSFADLRALGIAKPEDLEAVKAKLAEHKTLKDASATEQERAVEAATEAAKDKTRGELFPQLVMARVETAAARAGLDDARLKSALEFVGSSKFLNAAGEIDTDKVKSFVAGIAPAKGNQPPRSGPTFSGGRPGGSSSSGGSGGGAATGREMFEQRHPKSKTP